MNALQAEMIKNKTEIFRGPVSVSFNFHLIKPKSAPKKKVIYPIKRPDLDKLIRAGMDALTGTIVIDDSQITYVDARKVWETNGPGVLIVITEGEFDE